MKDRDFARSIYPKFKAGVDRMERNGHASNVDSAIRGYGGVDDEPVLAAAIHSLAATYAHRKLLQLCGEQHTDSPIEEAFWIALNCYAAANTDGDILISRCYQNGVHSPAVPEAPVQLEVCCQHQVGRYRVDFLLTGHEVSINPDDRNGPLVILPAGSVLVECDGHDFHERTKEQAKRDRQRDRDLQRAGFQVFRFTGSEIFADPFKCAEEAFNAAFGKK